MTSCLCVYCTECFTELLAKAGRVGTPPSIQCVAYEGEKIEDYTVLSTVEWEALLSVFNDYTATPDEYSLAIHDIPDDIERLWKTCQSENAIDQAEADHSRISPELGDEDGAGEGSPTRSCQDELSSDGFDGESRSDGYESDFDFFAEAAHNPGLISQSGYVVDPRHDLADPGSTSDPVSSSGETNNSSFHEVTMSEIDSLVAEVPNWATVNDPVLIDLTEGGDRGDSGNGNAHATGDSKKHDGNHAEDNGNEDAFGLPKFFDGNSAVRWF
jgi:hypothetical protein